MRRRAPPNAQPDSGVGTLAVVSAGLGACTTLTTALAHENSLPVSRFAPRGGTQHSNIRTLVQSRASRPPVAPITRRARPAEPRAVDGKSQPGRT